MKGLSVLVFAACVLCVLSEVNETLVMEAVEFIASCRDPDGSVSTNPDRHLIIPAFCGAAIVGLSRAGAYFKNQTMIDISWGHIAWHAAHINTTTHFISNYGRDHKADPWICKDEFDSTDSYAALFFLALDETYWAQVYIDGNDVRAKEKIAGLIEAGYHSLEAILATFEPEFNLTRAKPSDDPNKKKACYTMDNSVVVGGLASCTRLPLDNDVVEKCAKYLNIINSTFLQMLWDDVDESFTYYKSRSGTYHTIWTKDYPDILCQVYPSLFGIFGNRADPRNIKVARRAIEAFPEWYGDVNLEGELSYTSNVMSVGLASIPDDEIKANARYGAMMTWEVARSRKWGWPFTTETAGKIISTELFEFETHLHPIGSSSSSSSSVSSSSSSNKQSSETEPLVSASSMLSYSSVSLLLQAIVIFAMLF